MDDRIRQILGSSKNKVSVNTDVNTNVTLDSTTRLIKPNTNPINSVVDVDDQYQLERDESNLFRVLGRLNIITSNDLTKGNKSKGVRGTDDLDWDPLFTEYYNGESVVNAPTNWVIQLLYPSDRNPDYNVWGDSNKFRPISLGMKVISLTSNNPSGNRSLLVVETKQKHNLSEGDYIHLNSVESDNIYQGIHKVFELGNNGLDTQTKITLETSWISDSTNEVFLNRVSNSSDGDVGFVTDNTLSSFIIGGSNNELLTVTTTKEHGLGPNSYVELRKSGVGKMNGLHLVRDIIDDFKFTIKPPNIENSVTGYSFRRMDGTPSDYYVRYFELLTGNQYQTYPTAFSSSIYPDTLEPTLGIGNKTWSFQMDKDVNTTSLISDRGGKVNELKFCMLKRSGKYPYDWSNVTSHWEFNSKEANTTNGLETVSINNSTGSGSIVKNIPKTLTNSGSKYVGDIIEYNRRDIQQKNINRSNI